MPKTCFTDHSCVKDSINELDLWWKSKKPRVSDVVDCKGHQYVDLVMEGGGVLGIALVGYTYALETVGIRFRHVGGTSAGAINALMVAALGTPGQPKSQNVLEVLAELNLFSFVDGGCRAQHFIRAVVERTGRCRKLWWGSLLVRKVWHDLGLNPGDAFLDWLKARLADVEVVSLANLRERMTCPTLYLRNGDGKELPKEDRAGKLRVVAADVTTNTKAVFPKMAGLYWNDPCNVSPAEFVRASMSIPLFFHPKRVADIPQGAAARAAWSEHARYEGCLPKEVLFVDGGIISNFPIDLFHSENVPRMPTFGVKLGIDRTKPVPVSRLTHLSGAIFDAARQGADYGFLHDNPDYDHLVAFVRTGDHNWLDFNIATDGKVDLFAKGVEAARRFLMRFNWSAYKEVRTALQVTRQ